jgi:predicted small lipoprotein YifL
MIRLILINICLLILLTSCGKIGPLSLPEEKLDRTVITYPCGEACLRGIEKETKRQQSAVIQVN